MMNALYASDRHFRIWTYSVSHRRLLLRSTVESSLMRSTDGDGPATRIDVMFAGVERMLLRPSYDGISIREVGLGEAPDFSARYGEFSATSRLLLIAPNLDDFVVAGWVQWHEDDGAFDEPSSFGHFAGATALGPDGPNGG